MDHKHPRNKNRTSYFGNVKNRLGPKLPAGVSTPPQFTTRAWEVQPAPALQQPVLAIPLNHIPHIRNPQLRQYYLQGTAWEVQNRPTGKQKQAESGDKTTEKTLSENTVFSISSQIHINSTSSTGPQTSSSKTLVSPQLLLVPKEKVICENSNVDFTLKRHLKAPSESVDTSTAQPQSPSPEAEYDKLLDVEAVALPDGQLCLLALPPECCQGEGPGAMAYLKLFCRYITDRKGVVAGILLVTPHKLFFDPCKSHPLVKEHGCEEYLLSCSLDSLASVSFYSDISHVHFNTSQQRRKGRTIFQKFKTTKSQTRHHPSHIEEDVAVLVSAALPASSVLCDSVGSEDGGDGGDCGDGGDDGDGGNGGDGGDGGASGASGNRAGCEEAQSRDMVEAESELDRGLLDDMYEPNIGTVLSSAATFCCGGQEATSHLKMEKEESVKGQRTVDGVPSSDSPGRLMFVRLRALLPPGKMKGLQLGSAKTLPTRDAWFALSQESSDELYAYLTQCRPDLCILEGQEEEEGEEEFVLIQDKEQEEDFHQRQHFSGDEWEMVLMEGSGEKPTLVIDREPEGLHSIVEQSHILEVSYVKELCKELPPRTVGYNWSLSYCTSRDGASLKSLYRRLSASDSPALILIKDALDEVFGAFLSHPLRPSESFYGTGETFLFMLHPRFKSFRWTGENSFFIKGDLDSFAIGGGSGHFGLWVDENLYLGRSSPCYTFNNCCLSETDDFRIMELEVWTFS